MYSDDVPNESKSIGAVIDRGIVALTVITQLLNDIRRNREESIDSKNLAAAVVLRTSEFLGYVIDEFKVPNTLKDQCPEEIEKLIESAEKAGWA